MANTYMKRCSIWLVIRTQIKTMRYYLYSLRWLKLKKKKDNNKCVENVKQMKSSYTAESSTTLETVWLFLKG